MLRALIAGSALLWFLLILSGVGQGRLRPALEAARASGEAPIVIDPLHSPLPATPADGRAPLARVGPDEVARPAAPAAAHLRGTQPGGDRTTAPASPVNPVDPAPTPAPASGRTREASPDDRPPEEGQDRRRPVFTLSDLPPAGMVEPVPRPSGADDGAPTAEGP